MHAPWVGRTGVEIVGHPVGEVLNGGAFVGVPELGDAPLKASEWRALGNGVRRNLIGALPRKGRRDGVAYPAELLVLHAGENTGHVGVMGVGGRPDVASRHHRHVGQEAAHELAPECGRSVGRGRIEFREAGAAEKPSTGPVIGKRSPLCRRHVGPAADAGQCGPDPRKVCSEPPSPVDVFVDSDTLPTNRLFSCSRPLATRSSGESSGNSSASLSAPSSRPSSTVSENNESALHGLGPWP